MLNVEKEIENQKLGNCFMCVANFFELCRSKIYSQCRQQQGRREQEWRGAVFRKTKLVPGFETKEGLNSVMYSHSVACPCPALKWLLVKFRMYIQIQQPQSDRV